MKLVAGVALLAAMGCSTPPAAEPAALLEPTYRLDPPDLGADAAPSWSASGRAE